MKAQEVGKLGETMAAQWLEQKGYQIITRNFHCRFGEIDIIAEKDPYIVFAEVKTRSVLGAERPGAFVDARKQRKLIKTALCYLQQYPTSLQPRFDVVELILGGGTQQVQMHHLENAFWVEGDIHELF